MNHFTRRFPFLPAIAGVLLISAATVSAEGAPKVEPKTVGTWEFESPDKGKGTRRMTVGADGNTTLRILDPAGSGPADPDRTGTVETVNGRWIIRADGRVVEDTAYSFVDNNTIKLEGKDVDVTMKRVETAPAK